MSTDLEHFQYLLLEMRNGFLDELPERCDRFDNLILGLEKAPEDKETFNELYRGVHSLKGSGGTHGLAVITTICHQLESLLSDAATSRSFGTDFANRALAYVDLLRRVEEPGRKENPDYTAIESDLDLLRQSALQSRKAGLVAESSAMMSRIYQAALADSPVRLTVVDNGFTALDLLVRESFDFAIIGRELKDLNGVAVAAALRLSQSRNQNLPVILVTSNRDNLPPQVRFDAVLARDQKLSANLLAALGPALEG